MKGSRDLRERRGFTLVEILLVIVMIGILSGVLVSKLSGRSQEARIARAQSDITGTLSLALDMFEQDVGRYPSADEGLGALVLNPGSPGWKGPYLKGGLKPDPWGTPYQYQLDPDNPSIYILKSAGPDRQFDTQDDISQ
jgi:general secretion pathway protein G